MSTPELEKALASVRWKGVEKNVAEVIAKALDTDVGTVERIVYAWQYMQGNTNTHDPGTMRSELFDGIARGENLDEDVARAIAHSTARGWRRAVIRWMMECDLKLEVPFEKLVPKNNPGSICNGCTWQLECVRDSLSTPEQCLRGKYTLCKEQDVKMSRGFQHKFACVTPVKLEDVHVTVTADHPRGTFLVNVMDVRL